MKRCTIAVALFVLLPCPALACSLCGGNPQTASTLRQRAATAKLILYGTMEKANLTGGTTEMVIDRVLRKDPILGEKKTITVPRYLPGNGKEPLKYVIFADVVNNKLDVYDGVEVKSPGLVDFLKGALELTDKDRTASLLYFYNYFDHTDDTVANDAYLEFAKATDAEVGQASKKLAPDKLKKLIKDPKTPANRVGLFAFLLGACGGDAEANLLRAMVDKPEDRTAAAVDGALAGYINLKPTEGWDLAQKVLKDRKRPFLERSAVLGTVRFYHGWKGKDVEPQVVKALTGVLEQDDIADMAIEDLRRWKIYDLTPQVLGLYGKKGYEAPLMRHAIVRYALCCPRDEAKAFIAERRKKDAEEVKDVEESLRGEKLK